MSKIKKMMMLIKTIKDNDCFTQKDKDWADCKAKELLNRMKGKKQ